MPDTQLALHGGAPVITRPIKGFNTIGEEELAAVTAVMKTGVLSAYVGAPGAAFMGGPRVRKFETEAAAYFGVRHAVAVNSWTSGLIAAVGAIGVEPFDEIITTPWTMVASAAAILHWNAIPVFADIDPTTFNIDPKSVERMITPRTRAIMAVDIFGQSCDVEALQVVCKRHNLKLITDTAQSPGATRNGSHAGTLGDIGGFSLNYHKHIHCGEGGILVTNDDRLARRMQLIRNHAEAVIDSDSPAELSNMIGYNFRMGELEAAIASEQLKKLNTNIASRRAAVEAFNRGLSDLEGISIPTVDPDNTHVYYIYGMTLDLNAVGVTRDKLAAALRAEGVPGLVVGYQNVHRYPLFRRKIAYGSQGFPWVSGNGVSSVSYDIGSCPVAEHLHNHSFLGINICLNDYAVADVELVITAFRKVWNQRAGL